MSGIEDSVSRRGWPRALGDKMTVMDIRVGGAEKLGFMARTAATLLQWRDSRVIREQLSRLSDRELDDIGLSRGDIRRVSRTR